MVNHNKQIMRYVKPSKAKILELKQKIKEDTGGELWVCENCGAIHHMLDQTCDECYDDISEEETL